MFWHEDIEGGFWCVTGHADIVTVNRDWETFSSYTGAVFLWTPADLEMSRMMMLNMDPPEHAKLRKLVNRGFTPRRIRELQEVLARRATTIVDDVIEQGRCDMVEAVAAELPLQAIAEFLGVPQEDRHLVFKWSNTMIGSDDPEYASAEGRRRARPRRPWRPPPSSTPTPRGWPRTGGPTPATTSSRTWSTPRSTATRSATWTSTSSSCCWPWRATRRPATPSPTRCWPWPRTPTSGPGCGRTRPVGTAPSRSSCAGPRR